MPMLRCGIAILFEKNITNYAFQKYTLLFLQCKVPWVVSSHGAIHGVFNAGAHLFIINPVAWRRVGGQAERVGCAGRGVVGWGGVGLVNVWLVPYVCL